MHGEPAVWRRYRDTALQDKSMPPAEVDGTPGARRSAGAISTVIVWGIFGSMCNAVEGLTVRNFFESPLAFERLSYGHAIYGHVC